MNLKQRSLLMFTVENDWQLLFIGFLSCKVALTTGLGICVSVWLDCHLFLFWTLAWTMRLCFLVVYCNENDLLTDVIIELEIQYWTSTIFHTTIPDLIPDLIPDWISLLPSSLWWHALTDDSVVPDSVPWQLSNSPFVLCSCRVCCRDWSKFYKMPFLDIPEVTPLRVLVAIIIGYITHYVVSNYKRYQHWKTEKIPEQNPWLNHYRIIEFSFMRILL